MQRTSSQLTRELHRARREFLTEYDMQDEIQNYPRTRNFLEPSLEIRSVLDQ